MVLGKFSLRHAVSRPGRTLLTLLSVVIGVAAVVSITIATATTRRAYTEMFAAVTGKASLEVTAEGGGAFEEALLATVADTPGVAAATPLLQRFQILYAGDRRVKITALGVDPEIDKAVRDYTLAEGRIFERNQAAVLLESTFARSLGVKVGDTIKMLTNRSMQPVAVVGLLKPQGAAALRFSGMVFLPLSTAQYFFTASKQLDSIQVVLDENADIDAVQQAIAANLPTGISVRRPVARSQVMEETLLSSEEALRLTTAFSLLLAAFIILNTFLMSIGERRRQLAIMRAIGATRSQIRRMVFGESVILGLLGTALGVVVGIGGAYVLSRALTDLMQVHQPPMRITALPIGLALAFGLLISVLGAFMPARRAARLSPMEGLSHVAPEDMEGTSYRFTLLGSILCLVSGMALVAAIFGLLPVEASVTSAVFLMLGIVLLVPVVLESISQVAVLALRPLLGVESQLAHRQVLRHRARSTLTVGVLFVASSTGLGMANALLDSVADVRVWQERALVGDFFVRAMMPSMSSGLSADLPEALGEELRQVRGIETLDSASFAAANAEGQSVVVIARDFKPGHETYLDLRSGDPALVRQRLHEGQVVIGTVLAQRAGLGVGDKLKIETRLGPKEIPIAGLANEYMVGGLAVFMQRDVARRLMNIDGVDAYVIKAAPGARAEVESQLKKITDKHGVLLNSFADITAMIQGMVAGIDASLWGILVLGFVVAAIGVVNTLTMNVLEQTRELGMLRIIAMTRRQVQRTILSQAAILGGIGLLPGVLAGVGVSYLLNLAMRPVIGRPVEFGFRPLLPVLCFLVGLVIVLMAAWLPARRAAKIDIAQALQCE
ncbi:MAG: ABC transporter permease [Planctomycetota bacterium]